MSVNKRCDCMVCNEYRDTAKRERVDKLKDKMLSEQSVIRQQVMKAASEATVHLEWCGTEKFSDAFCDCYRVDPDSVTAGAIEALRIVLSALETLYKEETEVAWENIHATKLDGIHAAYVQIKAVSEDLR